MSTAQKHYMTGLTTDRKVGGSSPSKRTKTRFLLTRAGFLLFALFFCFENGHCGIVATDTANRASALSG